MNIAIGSAQFGKNYGISNPNRTAVSFNEIEEILNIGLLNNIKIIDTAKNYGNSEEILGEIGVSKFDIITKLPILPYSHKSVKDWVLFNVEDSLKKLKLNSIDTLLLHNPEDLLGDYGNEIFQILNDLKNQRVLKKIGISVYDYNLSFQIIKKYPLDVIQGPFNLLDRRIVTSGFIKTLNELNIEFHARSVFLQGLLLMDKNKIPEQFFINEPNFKKWIEICENEKIDKLKTCLHFVINEKRIKTIIIGINTKKEFKYILSVLNQSYMQKDFDWLSSENLKVIDPRNWKLKETK